MDKANPRKRALPDEVLPATAQAMLNLAEDEQTAIWLNDDFAAQLRERAPMINLDYDRWLRKSRSKNSVHP
jgi:hypothetical protein